VKPALGELASETCGDQSICCCCPLMFCGNSTELGNAVAHMSGSSDFTILATGRYEITYTVQASGYPGDSAAFMLGEYTSSIVSVPIGQTGTGTASATVVLSLNAGEVLRIAPITGAVSANVTVNYASIYIQRIR
jgi:hypothetical protein